MQRTWHSRRAHSGSPGRLERRILCRNRRILLPQQHIPLQLTKPPLYAGVVDRSGPNQGEVPHPGGVMKIEGGTGGMPTTLSAWSFTRRLAWNTSPFGSSMTLTLAKSANGSVNTCPTALPLSSGNMRLSRVAYAWWPNGPNPARHSSTLPASHYLVRQATTADGALVRFPRDSYVLVGASLPPSDWSQADSTQPHGLGMGPTMAQKLLNGPSISNGVIDIRWRTHGEVLSAR